MKKKVSNSLFEKNFPTLAAKAKAAKKKAVSKTATQKSQDTLIKGALKHLDSELRASRIKDKVGPAISSKRFGNTPVVEDEQCSDPRTSMDKTTTTRVESETQTGVTDQVSTTTLKNIPLKAKAVHLPHVVVEALAGTGKTFTLIVGVAWAFGQKIWPEIQRTIAERKNLNRVHNLIDVDSYRVTPSPEQKLIWEALAKGAGHTKTITYAAFNKSIVDEFGTQWGWMAKMLETVGVTLQFATVNALGYKAVTQAYNYCKPIGYNPETVLARVMEIDLWELKKKPAGQLFVKAVTELVNVSKLTLTGWTEKGGLNCQGITDEELDVLATHFEVDTGSQRSSIYQHVRDVLENSCMGGSKTKLSQIDFNDQNWLPVVSDLPTSKVDLLLVDEGQDLPRCKQEFARRLGRRIFLVGDINQAIYGFAGADVHSIPRMKELLGVEESNELTVTYRCGKAIVREAQKIVPKFTAHDNNPEGSVLNSTMEKYAEIAEDNDMVLCRVNAPLVSQALKFVRDGRKAIIRGRDFGESLIKFVKSFEAKDVGTLITQVQDWADNESMKESSKKNHSEQKLITINDRKQCIEAFCEGSMQIEEVLQKIKNVFAGKQCPRCKKAYDEQMEKCYNCQCELLKPEGVLFSSIHRAKGLEANRVFLLEPKGATVPHPMAKSQWQIEQEWNCRYIAVTRAINQLVYVGDK